MKSWTLLIGALGGAALLLLALCLALASMPALAAADTVADGVSASARRPLLTDTAAVRLTTTVGVDPCPNTATTLDVDPGAVVYFCYTATNAGDVPFERQTLTDSALGILLNQAVLPLALGSTVTAEHVITANQSLTSAASWEAANRDGTVSAVAAAAPIAVNVRALQAPEAVSIDVQLTVGTDPNSCATTDEITAPEGQVVYYCLQVTNLSTVTLTSHQISSPQALANGAAINQSIPLLYIEPGQTVIFTDQYLASIGFTPLFLTQEANPGIAPVQITFTSFSEDGAERASATDAASVLVGKTGLTVTSNINLASGACTVQNAVTLNRGREIYYCIRLENTGEVTLTRHTLALTHPVVNGENQIEKTVTGELVHTLGPGGITTLYDTNLSSPNFTSADDFSLGPFTVIQTATLPLTVESRNDQGYRASATVTPTINVPATPLSLQLLLHLTNVTCPTVQGNITYNYGNRIYYCLKIVNRGVTPLTSHKFEIYISPPTRDGAAYAYSNTVSFNHVILGGQPLDVTPSFLTTSKAIATDILGPMTITVPFTPTNSLTAKVIYTGSNLTTSLHFRSEVTLTIAVLPLPTAMPEATIAATNTPPPAPGADGGPAGILTSTPISTPIPTATTTPVAVSALVAPIATPQARVRAVTAPQPGQFDSPIGEPTPTPIADSPQEAPTLTPDPAGLAVTQTADALHMEARMLAEQGTATPSFTPPGTETATATSTETPVDTATATLSPTPTITQRPLDQAIPDATPEVAGTALLGQAVASAITVAGWVWFAFGTLVFFVTAGIVVGLSFRQREQRRYRLDNHQPPDPSRPPSAARRPAAQPPATPGEGQDDNWPASLP